MRFPARPFSGMFFSLVCVGIAVGSKMNPSVMAISTFSHPQIVETWGWILAHDEKVAGIEITTNELPVFLNGFVASCNNRPLPYDAKIFPDVERLAKARREKIVSAILQKNQAQADKFLAALRKNTNIIALPENVFCKILKSGDGAPPKLRQTVNVHYVAHLIGGVEFYQAGSVDLVLVTNRSVCRGWIAAMQKLKKGGAMKLYVPPPLSEDEATAWGIEPGAMMIFEIELLDIKDTSPEDLANATIPSPPDLPPEKSGYDTLQIIEAWGWDVAQRARLSQCGLSDAELSSLARGFAAGIKGEPPPTDFETISPAVDQFVSNRREQARLKARQKRTTEMESLFADLKKNTKVVTLPDGLRYEILRPGSGAFPKTGQTVRVNFSGHLIDGSVFDKTMGEPLRVVVGSVIHGWNEGIQKIGKGGKIRLYIPPALGYGDDAVSGIPPGSTLIFEIELVDVEN